uniref:SJCHGC01988 protein n=1 Tax=Schistosoma japonicum TaxID=6182 RepID=Q5D9N5_SCHJA|nr:SJCHGC01988 protein [Schistosoma japonicum]
MMNIVFIVTSHIIYYPSTLFCCIFATFENKVNFAAKTLMYNMASCWLCMCESSELRSFALILFGKSHVMGLPLDCNSMKKYLGNVSDLFLFKQDTYRSIVSFLSGYLFFRIPVIISRYL